jgi:glycosyltransferase involved in cell wall biosynthesis
VERRGQQPTAPEVTIFIPCLNEEKNVGGAVETVVAACRAVGCSFEVLVFDDGSTDGTAAAAQAYQAAHPGIPVRLFRNTKNRGVAYNFVEGAFRGRGTYYRQVQGDNVEPQATLEALLKERGTADIIVPYFTEIRNRPFRRTVISRLYTIMVNLASGYRIRYYNGCPLYRRQHVLRLHVETTGFGYQAEFLTRLIYEGMTYREIPLIAYDRKGSASINLKNLLSVGHSLLSIALRRLRVAMFEQ